MAQMDGKKPCWKPLTPTICQFILVETEQIPMEIHFVKPLTSSIPIIFKMDDITEDQMKVVNELKNRTINDCTQKMLEDDSVLYRFAKARDFNLEEAETMLKNHIVWRKQWQIDTILTDYEPPEVFLKYIPTTFLCFSKDGRLVRINDAGRTDLKGLMRVAKKLELSKFFAYLMELDKERVLKSGRNLGTPFYLIIYDFENLSYSNAVGMKTFQFLHDNLKMFTDNFPETIKLLNIINAPTYFAWPYAVIKRLLPSTVTQKFRIYDTDTWKEDFLELIDADDLPGYLGGNRTDPDGDPLCKTFIQRGRPIPKSYYMNKGCKTLSLEPDVKKLTVPASAKEQVDYKVEEENSYLEWEFETQNRDIEFSLVFKEQHLEDFKMEQIIPKLRIDTSDEPEKGRFKCEKVGTYTIIFDNSFSWLRSKEVYYRVSVQVPKNEDIYKEI